MHQPYTTLTLNSTRPAHRLPHISAPTRPTNQSTNDHAHKSSAPTLPHKTNPPTIRMPRQSPQMHTAPASTNTRTHTAPQTSTRRHRYHAHTAPQTPTRRSRPTDVDVDADAPTLTQPPPVRNSTGQVSDKLCLDGSHTRSSHAPQFNRPGTRQAAYRIRPGH